MDRSRRPHSSPARTSAKIEGGILAIRDAHPAWGARKIVRCLEREGIEPPAVSSVHAVLARHGRIVAPRDGTAAEQRFEKRAPNLLWQMDFKGWIKLGIDEADAAKGLISFRAPLAQAVLGAREGDVIEAAEPLSEIEIVSSQNQ